MNSLNRRATLTLGISWLAVLPLFGQVTAARPPTAAPANQPPDLLFSQDEKEKTDDAALLQQLESSAPSPDSAPKPKRRSAGATVRGGGGGASMELAPAGMPFRGQTLLVRPGGAPKAVLVRTSDIEPKAQAALEEDLAVMGHLLNKAIDELPGGQPRPMNALGIDVFPAGSSPMRSLYLDNYGAVFFLSVNFPLVAPPEKAPEEKQGGDSAWEDARQELYGQRLTGAMVGEPAEDYSQEKVDRLKQTLLEALKNATNIRELKPEEFVTIWVSGAVTGNKGRFRVMRNNSPMAVGANLWQADQLGLLSRRTILTIRASKSEIDAYAKGKRTPEEFAKHARITTYSDDSGGGSDMVVGGNFNGKTRF